MDTQTQSSAPRRLFRRSHNKMIGGVAGGLGDYTGLDPVIFRIGFIVLMLVGGAGVFLYACAWLLIPEESSEAIGLTLIERLKARRVLSIVVLVISALFLFDWIQMGSPGWGVLWGVVLVAAGYALLRDDPARDGGAGAPAVSVGPAIPALARPKRRRSPLGLMTLGAMCVALALAALMTLTGVVELDAGQFLALAVMVLGLGMVVGAWWGRARFLTLIALPVAAVMVAASMIDVPLKWATSNDYYRITQRNINDDYYILAGSMTLDFSDYEFVRGERNRIDVSFFAGNVEIYVPPGVFVEVTGDMDAGVADLFGKTYEGSDIAFDHEQFELENRHTEGALFVDVEGGLGSFDTTWARWVEQNHRIEELRQQRRERNEGRKEVKRDAGRNRKDRDRK